MASYQVDDVEVVQRIYNDGSTNGLWVDAEAFLDRLDVATEHPNSPPARQFCDLLWHHKNIKVEPNTIEAMSAISQLRGAARRFVALQCHRITESHGAGLESWNAYNIWVEKLRASGGIHTVQTFNYDLVLERLGVEVPTNQNVHHLDTPSEKDEALTVEECERVYALKLHGSIGWMKSQDDGAFVQPRGNWHLPTCDGNNIGIAAPGPGKNICVDGPLKNLWTRGLAEIRRADSVIFVGYRFPPSDAMARSKLLEAIGQNEEAKHLTLNIVLGPKLGSDDNVRLKALLAYTAKNSRRIDIESGLRPLTAYQTFQIIEHPLWAEDFVTVWQPTLTRS
jgi:hypothetical protein